MLPVAGMVIAVVVSLCIEELQQLILGSCWNSAIDAREVLGGELSFSVGGVFKFHAVVIKLMSLKKAVQNGKPSTVEINYYKLT